MIWAPKIITYYGLTILDYSTSNYNMEIRQLSFKCVLVDLSYYCLCQCHKRLRDGRVYTYVVCMLFNNYIYYLYILFCFVEFFLHIFCLVYNVFQYVCIIFSMFNYFHYVWIIFIMFDLFSLCLNYSHLCLNYFGFILLYKRTKLHSFHLCS